MKNWLGSVAMSLIAGSLMFPGSVRASQEPPEPSRSPNVEGPLIGGYQSPDCTQSEIGDPRDEVEGTAEICTWLFAYLPVLELNPVRDYYVIWKQVLISPRAGYCVRRLDLMLRSQRGEVLAASPNRRLKSGSPVRLSVDTEGHGLEAAAVSQRIGLTGGVLTGEIEDGEGARFTLRGGRRGEVFAAMGVELAEPPESLVSLGLVGGEYYELRRCGR